MTFLAVGGDVAHVAMTKLSQCNDAVLSREPRDLLFDYCKDSVFS